MDITVRASFLPHDDPDAPLAFGRDRPEVVLLLLRAGPGEDERPPADSPSGAIGTSISELSC
jgi:hypothetical protein